MNDLKDIGNKYGGAIIGFLVGLALAIILFCTDLYKIITGILLVIACVYFGNYIQKNKDHVKESTKNFIDKL